jgi:hypothetical protein
MFLRELPDSRLQPLGRTTNFRGAIFFERQHMQKKTGGGACYFL